MTDTSPPSSLPGAPIESLLATIALNQTASEGMRAMTDRQSEFANPLQAQLTGIALDPYGRQVADEALDTYWSDERRKESLLRSSGAEREIVIGSGFHTAVYAATRVLSGYPKPLVVERHERAGGAFAMTTRPTFNLNSRNRPGSAGLAGDQGASLNYLPGAPIQAANVSMSEFQTNTDLLTELRQGSDSSGRRGGLGGATFRSHDRRSRWAERSFWSGGGAVRESAAHRGPVRAVSAG